MKKRAVSSTATGPRMPRSRRKLDATAKALPSSCHTRTAAGTASVSRTDGSSKKGVTIHGSPSAGSTASVGRSLRLQRTPVK